MHYTTKQHASTSSQDLREAVWGRLQHLLVLLLKLLCEPLEVVREAITRLTYIPLVDRTVGSELCPNPSLEP